MYMYVLIAMQSAIKCIYKLNVEPTTGVPSLES